jgi:glycosyltransferase involved in cell wall biosynthesis
VVVNAHASGGESPLVSIVIPARNEAESIAATLDACLAIEYAGKEILVVDDSTDETPEIVSRYAEQGVRLIHREENRNGCCGARNLGMQTARGEIIVLMNADNRPRPDFLRRILAHYRDGADLLVVQSRVQNRDNIWGQYLYAEGRVNLVADPFWSEGFSCRRRVAEAVGYLPGDFPVPFCRDNLLSQAMTRAGFTKHVDRNILMEHVVPDTLNGFWRNRTWRGTIVAPYNFYFGGMSAPVVALREIAKVCRTLLLYLLVLPPILRAVRSAPYTIRRWRSIPSLIAVGLVQDAALIVGNLKGVIHVVRAEGALGRYSQGGETIV